MNEPIKPELQHWVVAILCTAALLWAGYQFMRYLVYVQWG